MKISEVLALFKNNVSIAARELEVTPQTIHRWKRLERDGEPIPKKSQKMIAHVTDLSVDNADMKKR